MRRTRQSVKALLFSVLLVTACDRCGSPQQSGAAAAGEGTSAAPQVDPSGSPTAPPAGGLLARADALLESREYAQAAELLAAQPAEVQHAPETAQRLVRAWCATEEVPKAERLCRDTLVLHPDATAVSLQLAQIYLSLNQYPKAVDVLRAAREHGASDSQVALTLGVCLGRLEDLDGARAEFERAKQAGAPAGDVDYNMAVLLHQKGQQGEAEQLLRAAVEETDPNTDARRELARVLLCATPDDPARLEEAVEHLNAVLDADPQDWRANELMGDVSMIYGDPEAAVFYYTDALKYGHSPEYLEDKYRGAAQARNDLLRAQGVLKEDEGETTKNSHPPIPEALQERWDRARRARAESEAAAKDAGAGGESTGG